MRVILCCAAVVAACAVLASCVPVDTKPILLEELQEHFDEFDDDQAQFAEMSNLLQQIQRLALRRFYGNATIAFDIGIVAHEIGHALGFWHEQSRPDADQHIMIQPQNIINSLVSNFLQRSWAEVVTHDVPFDLGSVMHYGPTAFTNDWTKKTIVTNDPEYQRTIGQREKPSFYDVQLLNKEYCPDKCASQLSCAREGYPHPSFCNYCLCPDGVGGYFCERNEPAINARCGGVIQVGSAYQEIESPGYDGQGYEPDQKCSWILRAPAGRRIEFRFIDRYQFFCTTTCLDYVEVKTHDVGNTGKRYCCYDRPPNTIWSEKEEIIVIFRSTISRDIGFKAKFRMYPSTPLTSTTDAPTTTTTRTTPSTTTKATTTQPTTTTTPALPTKPPNVWSPWEGWTECSKSCGGCGIKTRTRNCVSPPCNGDQQQFRRCAFDTCPGDTTCTKLNFFDEPCGLFNTQICSRVVEVSFRCNSPSCCPPYGEAKGRCVLSYSDAATWGGWSEWGACVGPECGGCAYQARHRVCNDQACDGEETQYQRCRRAACKSCKEVDRFMADSSDSGDFCGDPSNKIQCQLHRDQIARNRFTCPCCVPLRYVNGKCID